MNCWHELFKYLFIALETKMNGFAEMADLVLVLLQLHATKKTFMIYGIYMYINAYTHQCVGLFR